MFIKLKWFPLSGFKAIMLFGLVFHKGELTVAEKQHENVHVDQFLEMFSAGVVIGTALLFTLQWFLPLLILPLLMFYGWYLLEYFVRLALCGNADKAYKSIAFEQEAYDSMHYVCYERVSFRWLKFLFRWARN